MTLLLVWSLLTMGFTYLSRFASQRVVAVLRLVIVANLPVVGRLLACGWCTSFWTGTLSCGILVLAGLLPAWALALAGVAGTGLFDILERVSPSPGAALIAEALRAQDQDLLERLPLIRGDQHDA